MGLIVDNFAGGGGASTGIELAIGRSVDIAINHDPAAIAMHRVNHPTSKHYCENVWEVDPVEASGGQSVDLAWFSPDCKHFSKAKGSKPVDKEVRGLAWVAVKWAKMVKPKVIMLENVEEFKTWGPLLIDNTPDPKRKGETFNQFINTLKKFGYKVDFRELRASDYGAPTSRKRFFMIARSDGKPIKWPEPTHGNPDTLESRCGLLKPWRTAAEIIDWSIPCPSIFGRKKPLAENTLKRIARGLQKFVIENPHPFLIQTGYGERKGQLPRVPDINKPLGTIVSTGKHALVTPFLTQYHSYSDNVRGQSLEKPIMTIDSSNRYGLVSAFISKYYGGYYEGAGSSLKEPLGTITTKERHALVTAFLLKYYGNEAGQSLAKPLHTITTKDRFSLITVQGEQYSIADIGMRMLQPRELFNAQGFPPDYIIDHDYTGKAYPKTAQVARCGNAVPPPFAEALVRANLPEICVQKVAM